METHTKIWITLLVSTVSMSMFEGCGGSVNKFSYVDRRAPQLINATLNADTSLGGGQKPTQMATSATYGVRHSKLLGPIQPAQAASTNFVVRVGGL